MKKAFLLSILFAINLLVFSQVSEEKVFNAQRYFFYGFDFTHFKLAEAKRLNDGEKIKEYVFPWIELINQKISVNDIANKMNKFIVPSYEVINELNQAIDGRNIVSTHENKINDLSILSSINAYNLDEKEGVGFVIFVECFYKITESASAYYVFFDIASREILYKQRIVTNKPGGWGLTAFWGENLVKNFKVFLKAYKTENKKFKK